MISEKSPPEEGKEGVNYIIHMNNWFARIYEDDRLHSTHIALYLALFQCWNVNRFRNPFTIFRAELMQLSKIGSANTYTRCLKELNKWGYLNYTPSFNPMEGSKVDLYRFDKGGDNGTDKTGGKVLRPYIKQSKQAKKTNTYVDQNKNFDEPL